MGSPVKIRRSGGRSYVEFYYTNAAGERIRCRKANIPGLLYPNRQDNDAERDRDMRVMRDAIEALLNMGWTPEQQIPQTNILPDKKSPPALSASIESLLSERQKSLKPRSFQQYASQMQRFIRWLKQKHPGILADQIQKKHISQFLSDIVKKDVGPKARNNYLTNLRTTFNLLIEKEVVLTNPTLGIRKLKEQPQRNTPYLPEQIPVIVEHLEEHNPYLLTFIRFIAYCFLRPNEVINLQVQHIDLNRGIIYLPAAAAKTHAQQKRIPDEFRPYLEEMNLNQYPDHYYLFSNKTGPGPKRIFSPQSFSKMWYRQRQNLIKKHLPLTIYHSIYSFRHTFISDYFNGLIKKHDGNRNLAEMELMQITGHDSPDALRKYLRKINAYSPPDHSGGYSLSL